MTARQRRSNPTVPAERNGKRLEPSDAEMAARLRQLDNNAAAEGKSLKEYVRQALLGQRPKTAKLQALAAHDALKREVIEVMAWCMTRAISKAARG